MAGVVEVPLVEADPVEVEVEVYPAVPVVVVEVPLAGVEVDVDPAAPVAG